jgi:hypothetical protein
MLSGACQRTALTSRPLELKLELALDAEPQTYAAQHRV